MQDGIYHVRFSSSTGDSGEGLVVIKQGTVNGGDGGYIYVGPLASAGGGLSGRLSIKRWNPSATSVFGPLGNFDLQLAGQSTSSTSFVVSGSIPSQPSLKISIAGQFVSLAA